MSIEADSLITVSIGDSGEGMSPEFIHERLFRDYVRTLGGQMEVTAEIGAGTIFLMRLSSTD